MKVGAGIGGVVGDSMQATYWATAVAVATALVAFSVTGRRPRLDLWAVLLWAGTVVVGTVVAVLVLRPTMELDSFGRLNVIYRQAVVGLPLAAGLIALRSFRRGWRESVDLVGAIALACALLLAPLGIWMSLVEPNLVVVRRETLALAGVARGEEIRLGILSDLQMGDTGPGPHERRAVDALMAEDPDVILIAGDIVQSSRTDFDRNLPALRALLARLSAPGGTYLVQGDVDERDELARLVEGTDLRWLSDDVATSRVGGTTVVVGGIDLEPAAPGAQRIADELEAREGDEVRILLAHRPDAVELLPAARTHTDLVVAGHTHGGQVVVPFFGPLMTLSEVPRDVAAGGLHRMGDRNIFVTSGVGVERHQAPKLRLFDPPSVAVLTLTTA